MPGVKAAVRPLKFAPGWLRGEILAAIRRNGHKRMLNKLAKEDPKAIMEWAIKLEPKDINTQTQVNIKVVSIPSKVAPGQAIEPADYKVIEAAKAPDTLPEVVDNAS